MRPKSPKVSKKSSRIKYSCKTPNPTTSSAKMYRASTSTGSTNRPYTFCKIIEKLGPARNNKIQTCKAVKKAISGPAEICCKQIRCIPPVGSSTQLDQLSKPLVETNKCVDILRSEVQEVDQLHHILHNKSSPLPPKNKKRCQLKVPSVPIKQELKPLKQTKNLNRETKTNNKKLEKSRNGAVKTGDIHSKCQKQIMLLQTEVQKLKKGRQLFRNSIKEKDEKIKYLEESNLKLAKMLEEQACLIDDSESDCNFIRNPTLADDTRYLKKAVAALRRQVLDSTAEVLKQKKANLMLEKVLSDVDKKLLLKTKKQNENLESAVKRNEVQLEELRAKINVLSEKLVRAQQRKNSSKKRKTQELQAKLGQYESCGSESKTEHEKMLEDIEQLTIDFELNKNTLQKMTKLNKEQEGLILSQKAALLLQEDQLEVIETKYENSKIRNESLAKEMEDLKKNILKPCNIEACLSIPKELAEIRHGKETEEGSHSLEEIIFSGDQSQTILIFQSQLNEKKEISKMDKRFNGNHQDQELVEHEKEKLITEKVETLERQNNHSNGKINKGEEMLHGFEQTYEDHKNQRGLFDNFQPKKRKLH